MSDLTVHALELDRLTDLRSRAASFLTGAAATKASPIGAVDALAVLPLWRRPRQQHRTR